jgi:hypothetical protein
VPEASNRAGGTGEHTMSNVIVASIGAIVGLLAIYSGLNFHIGQWFIGGAEAYIPSAIGGAAAALFIRYLLRLA